MKVKILKKERKRRVDMREFLFEEKNVLKS